MAKIDDIMIARAAVLEDLERRIEEKDPDVGFHKDFTYGQGDIGCPICKTGRLRYSRSGYSGHIHGRCVGCISWME